MSSDYIRSLKETPYSGTKIRIVLGIDVGTTFSGVSYTILCPGKVPQIHPVVKFSDQEVGDKKIPSVLYYGENGTLRAIGASTGIKTVIEEAQRKNWIKVEYFKMHFRPSGQANELGGQLPPGKSAEQVLGDFLRYLVEETGKYLSKTPAAELWNQAKDEVTYILGHPNGWTGYSQQRYRDSAILGGLISDTADGRMRVKFVTEGEASALACLQAGLGSFSLQERFRFVIADAGGGTIDTTTFEITGLCPLRMVECTERDCRFSGSVYVNKKAQEFLDDRLGNSKYADDIEDLINDEFEVTTKRQFTGENEGLLKVGGRRENNDELGISCGKFKLHRDDMAKFFEYSSSELIDSIRNQLRSSGSNEKLMPVWLVGGFGSSPYLQSELRRKFETSGTIVQTPDTNLSKAVARGAILHYVDEIVVARVNPRTYGTDCCTDYDPKHPEHRRRPELIKRQAGDVVIGPIFSVFAEKGWTIEVGKTVTRPYEQIFLSKEQAALYSTEMFVYDGDPPTPYWYDENNGLFSMICKLEADLSPLWEEITFIDILLLPFRPPFKYARFEIEMKFGTTELEARIKWKEKGVVKYGPPAKVTWLK